jgi:hypothetical protein
MNHFFFYDSLVRKVWIVQDKRSIVRVTGSHQYSCIFGSMSIEGKQLIRYYDIFNGDTVYLHPTTSSEFMVMEEVWNIAKGDLFVLKYYASFIDLKNKIYGYFRTKRFNLNMRNYLLREVR